MQAKFLGYSLIALFTVWAVCAALGVMGQRKLFYQEGSEELYDYWMPRMCLEQGYVGHPEKYAGLTFAKDGRPVEIDDIDVLWSDWYTDGEKTWFITGWRDRVYPLFGILPLKPFPATRLGGYMWTSLAGIVLLTFLCLIAKSWWPLVLGLSMPFIFNFERGNTTWLSAAFLGMFLAWWDDEKEWKRLVAAACLAVAGAMKVTPFAMGAIYFTKWRWRSVLLCGFLSVVFVFVPWFFVQGGMAELSAMVRNAAAQSQFMQRASDVGLVQLWRTFRIVTGQCVQEVWPGMKAVAILSQLIGVAMLVVGAKRRDYLLMVGGMLWAAGNMYYYAMLYLLPVLVIELFGRVDRVEGEEWKWWIRIELGLWLALLSPMQIVVLGHSANQVIGNVALMGLMGIRLVCGGNCFAATAFAEATVVKKSAKSTERFEPRNTLNTRKMNAGDS